MVRPPSIAQRAKPKSTIIIFLQVLFDQLQSIARNVSIIYSLSKDRPFQRRNESILTSYKRWTTPNRRRIIRRKFLIYVSSPRCVRVDGVVVVMVVRAIPIDLYPQTSEWKSLRRHLKWMWFNLEQANEQSENRQQRVWRWCGCQHTRTFRIENLSTNCKWENCLMNACEIKMQNTEKKERKHEMNWSREREKKGRCKKPLKPKSRL